MRKKGSGRTFVILPLTVSTYLARSNFSGGKFTLVNSLRVQSVYHDGEIMRTEIKAVDHITMKPDKPYCSVCPSLLIYYGIRTHEILADAYSSMALYLS